MPDSFSSKKTGLSDVANNAFAVTPHDSNSFAQATRALWIGGTGDVKVRTIAGDTVTFIAVPAGTLLPLRVDMVYDTDTDATNIIGLF